MKQLLTLIAIFFSMYANAQNVGIGTLTPTNSKLVVVGVNGNTQAIFGDGLPGVSVESNSPLVGFNNYYLSGRKYMSTGYAGSLQMSTNTGHFYMSSYGTGSLGGTTTPANILMTVLQTGNVGIGNTTPTLGGLVVDTKVGATNAIFGTNTSGVAIETSYPGIGFNSYYNSGRKAISTGYGSLTGQDPLTGRYYISTSATSITGQGTSMPLTERLVIKPNGNIGVEGNSDPSAPVSFANTVGNKISLWGDATSGHYGLGLQGGLLQMYSDAANSDIAFGYGSSSSFTENMRIKGNGNVGLGTTNPTYILDVKGRMRIRSTAATAGLWFNKASNIDNDGTFLGQLTDQKFGIYSANAWQFAVDNTDGTVFCGSPNLLAEDLTKGAGYRLRVYGKIISEEVRVQLKTVWPDYVFEKDYKKLSISELEKYLDKNKHLPNIPSASEIEKDGQQLGEIQRKMMEKVEELSLYIIDLNKRMEKLEKENAALKTNNKLN